MTEVEFTEEYERHGDFLFRFICKQLNKSRRGSAEDIASQSWFLAWRSRDQFAAKSSFRGWLTHIAMNVIRSRWRSENGPERGGGSAAVPVDAASNVPNRESSVESRLHAARQMNRLMPSAVHLLTLRYIEGLSMEELAERYNCPLGTVKVRLMRTQQKARLKLGQRSITR